MSGRLRTSKDACDWLLQASWYTGQSRIGAPRRASVVVRARPVVLICPLTSTTNAE